MMSDENATPEDDKRVDPEGFEDTAQADPDTADATDAVRIAELEAENADLKDRVMRAVAEMENLRRRTEREVKETKAYAIAGFARDMLVATDNLSRALMTVPAQDREEAEGTLKSLIEGIDMTEHEMQRLLQKHGVSPIVAQGERFDPHKHQAMFEVPDESVPEGTVVQVMQEGYAIGERVLRPSMVGVSKGGPKRAAPSSDAANAEASAPEPEIDSEAFDAGDDSIDKSV